MANQSITVELDEETIRSLAAVGKPIEVLARLAHSAADGLRHRQPQRGQTDVSLRVERDEADAIDERDRTADEKHVDALVQAGRDHADRIAGADDDAERARALREHKRSNEDAEVGRVREERRKSRTDLLAADREATDHDLSGERVNTDTLMVDLRDVNEQIVIATIRAQEMTDELRESEERYRTLFDLSPTAFYSCDASGAIQKYNRHAAELWGREPAIGDAGERFSGSFKMFRPDGSFMPAEECPMAQVLNGTLPAVRDAEVVIEHPDGTRITVVMNIDAIKNDRGEVTHAFNSFHDISERKHAEILMAEALRAERERAEFREMFIGILGHDLRTPIASIHMAAGMLLERGHLDEHDVKTVGRIIRSDQRMSDMITHLLDLTRVRLGGGMPLERQPADLRDVIRDVVEEYDRSIQVETTGDLTGSWDVGRLSEVLSNLTGNAIEYATRGTAVTVRAHADETHVVVEVANQGAAIPADVLPFIFEPFRRARQREKSARGNLGLGLYIARQIVLAHGGTLDGHSAGGTTTFVMCLPRTSATA